MNKDSDVALDPRGIADDPRLEDAMRAAGFIQGDQPGAWLTADGIPVDFMVPESVAGPGSPTTRGARIPPHSRRAARRATGLEAALVDNDAFDIYRVLIAVETPILANRFRRALDDDVSATSTATAPDSLRELFADPDGLGAQMAGRSVDGVGDPDQVAVAVSLLAGDLLDALRR